MTKHYIYLEKTLQLCFTSNAFSEGGVANLIKFNSNKNERFLNKFFDHEDHTFLMMKRLFQAVMSPPCLHVGPVYGQMFDLGVPKPFKAIDSNCFHREKNSQL